MNGTNLLLAGKIAALEQALKQIIWALPNAQTLIAKLPEAVEERSGVTEMTPIDPDFRRGYLNTVDILGNDPHAQPPAPAACQPAPPRD